MIYKYYLGLGSNIEPKLEFFNKAIFELSQIGKIISKSAIYETTPWGKFNQDSFINAVIRFHSNHSPFELLYKIKQIEKKLGRKSNTALWGPREIDIDILFADQICINKKGLTIPHKFFKQRNFVLEPMAELNHLYIPEDSNQNIQHYLENTSDNSFVNKSITNW